MNQFQHDPAGPPPPRQSSGSIVIWILLLVFVVPMLLCGGLCAGFLFVGRRAAHEVQTAVEESMQEMESYRLAWWQVKTAPEVISRLGEPIEGHLPSQSRYHDSGDTGEAEFRYGIHGPKGEAQVHVVGEKIDGRWWYETIRVTFDDGEAIELAVETRPIELE